MILGYFLDYEKSFLKLISFRYINNWGDTVVSLDYLCGFLRSLITLFGEKIKEKNLKKI